jgi:1-deoxy-D-xylulose-5-phosphate reductoisomerase
MTPSSEIPSGSTGVAVLGSTGSVGTQALDVIAHHHERFRVVALAAGGNTDLLNQQIARFRPDLVACELEDSCAEINHPRVMYGPDGLEAASTHTEAEIVIVATSGHAAIIPTFKAITAGKTIALANKEVIVCAGALVMPHAAGHGVDIRPVDSEHSAIWQSLGRSSTGEVDRLIVTASGGPFRLTPEDALRNVTLADALAHPTWSMGGKITIDSATLMNKGLEVIEARWLFDIPLERIEVVVHPESIIHSLVEFVDGSQIAQLSLPDMRLPIQYALTYPEHAPGPCRRLSLADIGALHFEEPDTERFPALNLARAAGRAGLTYPTVLSAADDIAVEAFRTGSLRFPQIVETVERVVDAHRAEPALTFEAIAAADDWARREAIKMIAATTTA